MAGIVIGVAMRLRSEEPRALNIKCLAHSLNLAVQACTNQNVIMNDTMNTIQEICKMIGTSAKRLQQFKLHQEDDAQPTIRPFCPTRWTVRLRTLESVTTNLKVIALTLSEIAHDHAAERAASNLVVC